MERDDKGPERLRAAIGAAVEAAKRAGQPADSSRHQLEATLSALEERLGSERTGSHFAVEKAEDTCVVIADGSAPVGIELVASFMEGASARRLGMSKAWLLPMGGMPATRWARALRRVITTERRGRTAELPLRLTLVWSQGGEMAIATVE